MINQNNRPPVRVYAIGGAKGICPDEHNKTTKEFAVKIFELVLGNVEH